MTPISLDSPSEPAGSAQAARVWFSKRNIWLTAFALAAVFAIYRIATFIPQSLDGPHTLRPILNAWFDAFLRRYQHPEAAYEDWRAFCLYALMVVPLLAAVNLIREHGTLRMPDRAARILCSKPIFFAAIAATMLLCRFPVLVDYQLNPDEGQFLAGAHKLFYEPNYFDSVDCGTSGPLNIYPLMLPAIFGISPDYASSRILVVLFAFCGVYLLYRTVRLFASDSIARIAVVPLAAALTVLENPGLVHYSSEQVPALLVALALYLAALVLHDPARYRVPIFLLGFLASVSFFTKLQSVPIVGAIGAVALVFTYAANSARRLWQPALLFVGGLLPLQLLNAALCLAAGAWTNFWMSYIVTNQRYADLGSNFVSELPGLVNYFVGTPEVGYFIFLFLAVISVYALRRWRLDRTAEQEGLMPMAAVSAIVVGALMATLLHSDADSVAACLVLIALFALLVSFLSFPEHGIDPVRWFGLVSMVATGAAVFSVYRPHRTFPSYLLFLFLPISTMMAWMLIRQTRETEPHHQSASPTRFSRLAFPLLFTVLAMTYATFLWGTRDPHRFRTTVATIRQPEGDFIRSLTSPQGQIFVWGWTVDPYLGSGRVSATRDLNLAYQFMEPEEVYSYYRKRMLNDLSHNPPELIIDAISTDSWFMADNNIYGVDRVPEFARFLGDFYRHIVDAYGMRFFLRADLASRAALLKMPPACAPAAVRCIASPRRFYGEGVTTPVMDDLPPVKLPEHALVEVQFTPFGRQTSDATILNNEATPGSFKGFRFQNIGDDRYRLLVGLGDRWALSQPIPLTESKPVWLSLEFTDTHQVRIQANGVLVDTMTLPAPMADGPGPINIGSWINGACRFSGAIQFFQIVDLGKAPRPSV